MTSIPKKEMLKCKEKLPQYDWEMVSNYKSSRSFMLGLEVYRLLYEAAWASGLETREWLDFLPPFRDLRTRSVLPARGNREKADGREKSLKKRGRSDLLPDEIVRAYFYFLSEAPTVLKNGFSDDLTNLLLQDRLAAHEQFDCDRFAKNPQWQKAVKSFASALLSIWRSKDKRGKLLFNAYTKGRNEKQRHVQYKEWHILPQYVEIDRNIAPFFIFERSLDLLRHSKVPANTQWLSVYDAIERLFYELALRSVSYNSSKLDKEGDSPGCFYEEIRSSIAHEEPFSSGMVLKYSCSYYRPLMGEGEDSGLQEFDFLSQFKLNCTFDGVDTDSSSQDALGQTRPKTSEAAIESYLAGIRQHPYFRKLRYRGGGSKEFSLSTEDYVEHGLQSGNKRFKEAALLDFGESRVNTLAAPGGCGKTACLIALTLGLATSEGDSIIRKRIGLENDRSQYVPLYISFNPYPTDQPKPLLVDGEVDNSDAVLTSIISNQSLTAQDIEKLEDRALFLFDALDEADDWHGASAAISAVLLRFPQSKAIVATRPLFDPPSFMQEGKTYVLDKFNTDAQKELFLKYLNSVFPRSGSNDDIAASFVENTYCRDLRNNALASSVAAREWPRDELDSYDSPAPAGPSMAFARVADRLLEKGYSVMGRQLGGKWPVQLDAKRIIGKLATLLVGYQHDLPYLNSGVNSKWFGIDEVTRTPFIWSDCFEEALETCFPSDGDERAIGVGIGYDFWKSFAVASGIISFVPGAQRDCFAFGSRDFMLYFCALEMASAMNNDLQSVLRFVGSLLDAGIQVDSDARRLMVMLASTISEGDRTAFEGIGLSASIIGLIVGCVEGNAIKRPIDGADGQMETARGAKAIIEDILAEEFGPSSLISYCHSDEDVLGINPFETCIRQLVELFGAAGESLS